MTDGSSAIACRNGKERIIFLSEGGENPEWLKHFAVAYATTDPLSREDIYQLYDPTTGHYDRCIYGYAIDSAKDVGLSKLGRIIHETPYGKKIYQLLDLSPQYFLEWFQERTRMIGELFLLMNQGGETC